MFRTLCSVTPFYAVNKPFNEFRKYSKVCQNKIDHSQKVEELSLIKATKQKNLDKRLNITMLYCREDKHTPICKIMWNDVHECLVDIDNVNQEIRYHKWYMFIEE